MTGETQKCPVCEHMGARGSEHTRKGDCIYADADRTPSEGQDKLVQILDEYATAVYVAARDDTDPPDVDAYAQCLRAAFIEQEPTPESLREWAAWFDNPRNPAVVVGPLRRGAFKAGLLLRRIACELARAHVAKEGA